MKRESIRIGVIGCGWVAEQWHLPALQSLPGAEVAAVADTNPERLRRIADRFGIPHRFPDGPSLLEKSPVDAIAVCVPVQFHVEIALAGLEAGKHLLIEKPIALSLDDADRLIDRVNRSDRKVMTGFNTRWHRLVRRAREIIREGKLGPVRMIHTILTSGGRHRGTVPEWTKRRELGGGMLVEVAVHHFDLWRFLLETEVEEVFAASRSGAGEDETAVVIGRLANGAIATCACSTATAGSNEIAIYGEAGRLRVSLYEFDGLDLLPVARFPGEMKTRIGRGARTLWAVPHAIRAAGHGGDFAESFRAEWKHFLDAIRQGGPIEATAEEGRRALQVVLAAAESAARGQPVEVSAAPRTLARRGA